jgi:hypothetical protein
MFIKETERLALSFLAQYVEGKKLFNLAEIQGGLNVIGMFEGSSQSEALDNVKSHALLSSMQSFMKNNEDINDLGTDIIDDFTESNIIMSDQNQEKISTKKTRHVWNDNFLNRVKDTLKRFMLTSDKVSRNEVFDYFYYKFSAELSDYDLARNSEKSRENYKNKLVDNIKAWFIEGDKSLTFDRETQCYHKVKKNPNQNTLDF